MKNALLLTAIASSLSFAAPVASANDFVTLSNFGDSIVLKKGETALVVSASDNLTVQYEKKPGGNWSTRTSQFRLAASSAAQHYGTYKVGATSDRFVPTWSTPFPLSGPCKIKLVTPGLVGMRVVSGE